MDYLNQSGLSQQVIKENINKKIIEELLSYTSLFKTLLELEIKDLNLINDRRSINGKKNQKK